MNRHKNILVVRTDRVGDVVLTLPVINLIKRYIPDSHLYFLANSYTEDLLKGNSALEKVFVLKTKFCENYRELKKHKIDTVITVSPNFRLALLFFLLRIRYRIGTGYRWYSFLFNKKHYEHRRYGDKHETEYNINLLKMIDIQPEYIFSFPIPITNEDISNVTEIMNRRGLSKSDKIIIIHPGTGGSAIDLPKEKMIYLTKQIALNSGFKICFTGSSGERELVNELNSAIAMKGYSFAGELNLRELAELIRRSKIFISNSTGPIHIAAVVGTHIIGFYPPVKAMSVNRWGPYTEKKNIFIPQLNDDNHNGSNDQECKKCIQTKCRYFNCMDLIPVEAVINKINEILNKRDSI